MVLRPSLSRRSEARARMRKPPIPIPRRTPIVRARTSAKCRPTGKWAPPIGVEIDRDGKSLWVFDRCGANDCAGSNVAPIMKFDPAGKLLTSFGAGMFAFPHGLAVDRDGNVWATDGKRHIVREVRSRRQGPDDARPSGRCPATVMTASISPPTLSSRPMAISSLPTAMAASPTIASCGSRRMGNSSRPGGTTARRLASSIHLMASRSILPDACSSPIGSTAAFRCSIRMEILSRSGSSSAGRAASSSIKRTSYT